MVKKALEHRTKNQMLNRIIWVTMNSKIKMIRAKIVIWKLVRHKLLLKLDWMMMLRLKTLNQR